MSGKVSRFRIGRDRGGLWIVCDRDGLRGAAFVSREAALRFARSDCEAPAQDIRFVAALDWGEMFAPPLRRVA